MCNKKFPNAIAAFFPLRTFPLPIYNGFSVFAPPASRNQHI